MSDISEKGERILHEIMEYCDTYNVPIDNLLDILEDQKVLPMIRGKATEYLGAVILREALDSREWDVQKLNLNPQQGMYDEDVSITYRRTGDRLRAETKNAVRGSFKLKTRNNLQPHFKVKCHKSRSNLKKADTTNDRYEVGEFDILLCNVSNSIFRGKSLDRGLPLIDDTDSVKWLREHYSVKTDEELRRKAYCDWRICIPASISQPDGTIPRTPTIQFTDDPNWFGTEDLMSKLRPLIGTG